MKSHIFETLGAGLPVDAGMDGTLPRFQLLSRYKLFCLDVGAIVQH